MAKRVRISSDGGTTWNTLPGNVASLSNEVGELEDTIFGQDWASTQVGLIGGQISSNALYKGFAGYVATIKQISGSATATTGEACTLVSGKTYQIDATAKRIWSRSAGVDVYDNAVAVDADDILSIDYLFGKVTFVSGYTVTGPVTVDVSYYGTAAVGKARSFSLTQTAAEIDDTDLATAQANSGHRTYNPGLRTVALEVGGIYDVANGFRTQLIARNEVIIELNPEGSAKALARGFFKLNSQSQNGAVGALEEETVNFNLFVPDDDKLAHPFAWEHANDSTLNQAVQDLLTAFQTGVEVDVQYLPDGSTGLQANAIVTEVSLSGGLEAMNEFTVNLRVTGALTTV